MEPRLSDVFVAAHDRDAECLGAAQWAAHERQYEVDVVNHQIVDDANIGRAERVPARPFGSNVLRFTKQWPSCLEGRIEALDVPDLKQQLAMDRQFDKLLRVRDVCRERLFDEDRDSCRKEVARHLSMRDRGHDDGDGVHSIAAEQLTVVGDPAGATLGGDVLTLFGTAVRHRHKLDIGKFAQNPSVMASESTDTDNGQSQARHD